MKEVPCLEWVGAWSFILSAFSCPTSFPQMAFEAILTDKGVGGEPDRALD